jgi:tetratricopeptide (TPR) repeat protein
MNHSRSVSPQCARRASARAELRPRADTCARACRAPLDQDAGNRYFASGNFAKALDLFTLAIDSITLSSGSPNAADASQLHLLYSNRSATFSAMRNFQSALEDAERVVALAPRWAKGFFRKGSALEGLVLFAEAAQAYNAGLEVDPSDPTLKKSAADLAALMQELKLTEAELSKVANPDADRFELMVRWLKAGGGKFPRLYLQYYSEVRAESRDHVRIPVSRTLLTLMPCARLFHSLPGLSRRALPVTDSAGRGDPLRAASYDHDESGGDGKSDRQEDR